MKKATEKRNMQRPTVSRVVHLTQSTGVSIAFPVRERVASETINLPRGDEPHCPLRVTQ